MSRQDKNWLITVAAVPALILLIYGYSCYKYPYGASHRCDLILYGSLENYAADHNGAFPDGQSTPEASLSLLYPTYADADQLGGKGVPESEAKAILESGAPLGPESCSWHYVADGLTIYDDPRIALFWDETGTGHSGERLFDGGYTVLFINGNREHIPGGQWANFLREQEKLLAQRRRGDDLHIDGKLPQRQIEAQLRVVGQGLYSRVFHKRHMSSSELIAHVENEPELGVIGLPDVSVAELRAGNVVCDDRQIRFVLKDREIVFNGSTFHFE